MTETIELTNDTATHLEEAERHFQELKRKGLQLDMTRGKPGPEQLDLSRGLLALPGDDFRSDSGVDTRNYGGVEGLLEMRQLFGTILDLPAEQVILGENASLQLMHDALLRALWFGVPGGKGPWKDRERVTFLCPVPGYDRHFALCEHFGIDMVNVPMTADGPDMDAVERLVADDASVVGMWCVPKYSNPSGAVYSDEVVDRLARMKTAAPGFRIFWDNAYVVHHLGGGPAPLKEIVSTCAQAGNPDRALVFTSTSKITFAGAGVCAMASSPANIADAVRHRSFQTIGPDKVNALRHVRFFPSYDSVLAHMDKHAAILAPRFAAIQEILGRELGPLRVNGEPVATWSDPKGGYFVSLDTRDGLAAEVVALAAEAGVKLTGAGATFPYKKDPGGKNIRLAPSLPPEPEVRQATELVACAVKLATLRCL